MKKCKQRKIQITRKFKHEGILAHEELAYLWGMLQSERLFVRKQTWVVFLFVCLFSSYTNIILILEVRGSLLVS